MDAVTFEIKEELAVLSEKKNGWKKEVNLVQWNNGTAKLDIRDWDPYHEKMSKGITLTDEEGYALYSALKAYFHE